MGYCKTGKRGFRGKKHARKASSGVSNKIRVYLCTHCGDYHITNAEARGKKVKGTKDYESSFEESY